MNTKIITQLMVVVAIIGLVVISTGCMDEKKTLSESDMENIKEKILESQNKIETYKMSMAMDMTMESGGMDMSVDSSAEGEVDNRNHKMQMSMGMNMPMLGETNMEMYFIEDTMYMGMEMMGRTEWVKTELGETEKENIWNQQSYIEKEMGMIKNSKVELSGDEKVRGVDSWVIKITPDKNSLEEYVMSEMSQSSSELDEDEMPGMDFKNIEIKYWIAKDSYFITKQEAQMDFAMTDEKSGESMNIEMDVSVELYDYNEPVNIVLPKDALNAKSSDEMIGGINNDLII